MAQEQAQRLQAKKSVLDSMTYSGKGTVTGEMKFFESETLNSSTHSTIARQCKLFFSKMLFLSMLLIHLVLHSMHTLRMHTITASFMILQHVVAYRIACRRCCCCCAARICALAWRVYCSARGAARRHWIVHACCALRLNEILEHASQFLGSGLSKIGPGDQGIVTPWRGRGRSGARGAGR